MATLTKTKLNRKDLFVVTFKELEVMFRAERKAHVWLARMGATKIKLVIV